MPLEPVSLDDLTWSDLTTAARNRIAGVSNGEWTLHAPVDPGITLLELFAAQLEQRLYWMDQPSDTTRIALLSLLGVRPKLVRVAGTVFCLRGTSDATSSLVAGAVIEQKDEKPPLRFTLATQQETQLLPIEWDVEPQTVNARRRLSRKQSRGSKWEIDIRLSVGGHDRSTELRTGQIPCLLPPNRNQGNHEPSHSNPPSGQPCESRIAFPLKRLPNAQGAISLLFDLDTPASILPQWLAESSMSHPDEMVIVEAPARLSWHYGVVQSEDPFQQPCSLSSFINVDDGTNGLRRSGVVRLEASAEFSSQVNLDTASDIRSWLVIVLRAMDASYVLTPRVRRILPNAVIGHHRAHCVFSPGGASQTMGPSIEEQIKKWRRLPGNRLELPLGENEFPIPASVKFSLSEQTARQLDPQQWIPTDSFSHHGPQDRCFVVDRERRTLRFGDGLNGRLPIPTDKQGLSSLFQLSLAVGGGRAGNVPAWLEWRLSKEDTLDGEIVNVVAAQGGDEAETPSETARRSRSELRRVYRAVTREDIEKLAIQTSGAGIKRAHAVAGLHPEHRSIPTPGAVTVFIVPDLPSSVRHMDQRACCDDLIALHPDPGALAAVSRRLNAARLVTQEIFVVPPIYESIELSIVITGTPVDANSVRLSITQTLNDYLHPLYGGPDGDGWPFGNPLRPSELVRVINDNTNPELQVREVGIRKTAASQSIAQACPDDATSSCHCGADYSGNSEPPRSETCGDVEIKAHALVALRGLQITFVPARVQTGGLS
ncbi:baseplate J/gp47 family protein [Stieleria varia]|uniref:Baseplate J-like protein n=1 Tax=Stieleria varia TaxID=2528005 RepID=A0A5C5ZX77_9BACT|nr:baseplate J/gp47 family protein [Stieleria varia]TWT91745.1 Baseplate J-like protein [Stieleria varia]